MKIIYLILVGWFFINMCYINNSSDSNLYTLHIKSGDIKCNYHCSRDLNNGWMKYYDHLTKDQKYIEYWKIDSITIHSENYWTAGPKDESMKYIKPTTY